MSIILGIDPGSKITGYGIIKKKKNKIQYIYSGFIKSSIKNLANRLKIMYDNIDYIICKYKPDLCAIEQIFMSNRYSTVLTLGQAKGAITVAVINNNLSIYEYYSTQIKLTITGKGTSKKEEIKNIVCKMLNLSYDIQIDESDALAIAITHSILNT